MTLRQHTPLGYMRLPNQPERCFTLTHLILAALIGFGVGAAIVAWTV